MALFCMLYWILLRKLTDFHVNRFFLLASVVISVLIAAFPVRCEAVVPSSGTFSLRSSTTVPEVTPTTSDISVTGSQFSSTAMQILIYGARVFIFMLRLIIQTAKTLTAFARPEYQTINQSGNQNIASATAAMPDCKQNRNRQGRKWIGKANVRAIAIIKGVTTGTATDGKGNFSLDLPGTKEAEIVISFVGFKSIVGKMAPGKTTANSSAGWFWNAAWVLTESEKKTSSRIGIVKKERQSSDCLFRPGFPEKLT